MTHILGTHHTNTHAGGYLYPERRIFLNHTVLLRWGIL